MSNAKEVVKEHAKGSKKTTKKETKDRSGAVSGFIRKLSGGLMIPIALLPLAGLFLGVGAGFENVIKQAMAGSHTDAEIAQAAYVFTVFKMIGDMIFGNLPILFCLGVAVAFSDDKGIAVFAGIIAWIVFNATQSAFIWDWGHYEVLNADGTILGSIADANGKLWEFNSVLGAPSFATGDQISIVDGAPITLQATDKIVFVSSGNYTVGPYLHGMVPGSVVAANIGITSMQTSVFGGILMGFWAAFMYNKFSEFEAPKVLGFFSGTRFVPIITFLTVPLWGLFFVLVWPAIGIGLALLGATLMSVPYGFDAFLFGVIERSLIPFGLHHAFYAPLWYTTVGGALYQYDAVNGLGTLLGEGDQGVWFKMQELGIPFTVLQDGILNIPTPDGWVMDASAFADKSGVSYDLITNATTGDMYAITHGMNPGQYQQGKFPFMLFGLPAAGAAMIMAAKKENRELAMSVIGAAALTSFLTGITEPIEFTFLFLAPYLYYGFHIWMAGLSFMLLDLFGSHIGMTFSGGIFDYALFGILPDATGLGSNSWYVPIIGIIYAPIYYIVFYTVIVKKDIKTPGREGTDVVMVTKADYKAAKGKGKDEGFEQRVDDVIAAIGGLENTTSINACITKLRLMVVDRSKVDDDALIKLGAKGVVGKGKSVMAVFGVEAEKFKTAMLKKKDGK